MGGRLILLGMATLLGFGAYQLWPEPPPPPPPLPSPTPTPVPFPVKVKVKRMIEEWKRLAVARQKGHAAVSRVAFAADLADIRAQLHREGRHGEDDLREIMQAAAKEAGYDAGEIDALLDAIRAEASGAQR